MAFTKIEALRISPKYSAPDWMNLDPGNPEDWVAASEIVRDRLEGRFLSYASSCLDSEKSGFVVLAIDSLLAETIQQFREGILDGNRLSRELVLRFLQGPRFQPEFDGAARAAYYSDIRCGLLHQAEAREMWLIRRNQDQLLKPFPQGGGYIIDVCQFHARLKMSFEDYLDEIQDPPNHDLRKNPWNKMKRICDVRRQRGATDAALLNH